MEKKNSYISKTLKTVFKNVLYNKMKEIIKKEIRKTRKNGKKVRKERK